MRKINLLLSLLKGLTCFSWNCYDYSSFLSHIWKLEGSPIVIGVSICIGILKLSTFIYHNFGVLVFFEISHKNKIILIWYVFALSGCASFWNLVTKYEAIQNVEEVSWLVPLNLLFILLDYFETQEVASKLKHES